MAGHMLGFSCLIVAVAEGAILSNLAQRAVSAPSPLSIPPTSNWEGIDGLWNTFAIRVGTPPQVIRGHVSTTSQQTWTINSKACEYYSGSAKDDCGDQRGGLYFSNRSSTAVDQGVYQLWIERNLNYSGNAQYGYDSIGLGYVGEGMPTVPTQIVGALAVDDFWFGHFGLHPKTTNFTNVTQNVPSYMTTLYDQKLIPSISWGYTAGASYRFAKVQSSLTLGGYDKNRLIHNNVTFTMAPDTDRDLLVYIKDITWRGPTSTRPLLPKPIYSFLDSTVPEIWLPAEACRAFELEFGLHWDNATQLYFVNETRHESLVSRNPNVTFTLSTAPEAQNSVKITFPYAAFDLTAKPPYRQLQTTQRYFPLRRATNESQYTLGRSFFQEAYVFADWQRQTFTVSQCAWKASMTKAIVPIYWGISNTISTISKAHMPTKIIVGIVIGVLLLLAAIIALGLLLRHKKRSRYTREELKRKRPSKDSNKSDQEASLVIPKHELDAGAGSMVILLEKDASSRSSTIHEAPENLVFELPGDAPKQAEADGRELSEKEAVRLREQRYNGIDQPVHESSNTSISPLPSAFGLTTTGISAPSSEATISGRSPISPVTNDNSTYDGRHEGRKLIDATQVHIIHNTPVSPASEQQTQGLPGEMLEGSNGWSFLPERSTEFSANEYKRFSFEK